MLEANKTFFHVSNNQVTAYLLERARPEIIIGLISALLATGLFWNYFDQKSLLAWGGCALALYFIRWLITFGGIAGEVSGSRSFLFFLMLFLCGILWGTAGYFVVQMDSGIHKTGLLTCIVCLSFLITMVYSGKLSYFLAFSLPAFGLTIFSLYSANDLPWNSIALYSLAAAGVFLLLISLIYRNTFLKDLQLKTEHLQLQAAHQSLIEESQKTEVALKSTTQKNNEISENLSKASEDINQYEVRQKSLKNALKSNIRIDPITKLSNRRNFLKTIQQEWQRSTRSKEPLTIAFINVDEFDTLKKDKNNNTVLSIVKKVGNLIKAHGRRSGDMPARLNKASFALLLSGADSHNASKIIDSIRHSINSLNLVSNNNGDPVTVHAGFATQVPNRKSNPRELLDHAEAAAFEAEFQGGDRVISFQTFHNIGITPWNSTNDGELNETNFQQKLLSQGYNTKREVIPQKTAFHDQSFTKPTLFAVYSGTFLLNIEGEEHKLNRGSSLILPEDVSFNAEVVGDEAVILYLEKR